KDFDSIKMGRPLVGSGDDAAEVAGIIARDIRTDDDEALVLMGHGVFNGNNRVYLELEKEIHDLGYERAFIGTVEAEPGLEHVLKSVKRHGTKKVLLAPLLIVSGDHANNDMAGDGDDSWATAFRREGIEVRCLLKGLGEYKAIREMFIKHAKEAK
ncbi:MAG: sirohydrochlorin cobaltochelatase, partial [Firmicutes bacterium]|nr:sirohydrochlorin cobaltochelatase [Bacillota bacterium]